MVSLSLFLQGICTAAVPRDCHDGWNIERGSVNDRVASPNDLVQTGMETVDERCMRRGLSHVGGCVSLGGHLGEALG